MHAYVAWWPFLARTIQLTKRTHQIHFLNKKQQVSFILNIHMLLVGERCQDAGRTRERVSVDGTALGVSLVSQRAEGSR